MPRPTSEPRSARERSRLESRARLLKAGERLFAERGFHKVNSNEIARAAGVATGTFYNHFGDKGALFEAIALIAHDRFQEAVEHELAELGEDPLVDGLHARVRALLHFASRNSRLVKAVLGPEGQAQGAATRVFASAAGNISADLEARASAGEIEGPPDSSLATELLTTIWVRATLWWAEHHRTSEPGPFAETLVRTTLAIIGIDISDKN